MNTFALKMLLVQITATIAVILINSTIAYSFFQIIIMDNLKDLINLKPSITDFFFLFFSLYLMKINIGIPFSNYQAVETDEDFQEEMKHELAMITEHIVTSAIFTALVITAMNYIRL